MSRRRLTQLTSALKGVDRDQYDPLGFASSSRLKPGEMAYANEKGEPIGREQYRDDQHKIRRELKREATRSAKQRNALQSYAAKLGNWLKLSPEEKERRMRRLPKGSRIAIVKSLNKIELPTRGKPQPEKKTVRDRIKQSFTRRKSGLIVPDRRSA